MDGYLPVKVMLPMQDYRRLYAQATARGMSISELLADRVKERRPGNRMGRPSAYTPEAAADIVADRRMGKSWNEIGKANGLNHSTAQSWAKKYQREVREQNARERAERNES